MLSLHERALRLWLDTLRLRRKCDGRLPSDRHRWGQRQAGERPSERLAEREARGGHGVRVGVKPYDMFFGRRAILFFLRLSALMPAQQRDDMRNTHA